MKAGLLYDSVNHIQKNIHDMKGKIYKHHSQLIVINILNS